MNRRDGEYEDAEIRLCVEQKVTGGASSASYCPKLIRWGIAVGLMLDGREITNLHFRILSHPLSHSVQDDYQTQSPPEWRGSHNSRRVASLAGNFSHFQVSITLICLRARK